MRSISSSFPRRIRLPRSRGNGRSQVVAATRGVGSSPRLLSEAASEEGVEYIAKSARGGVESVESATSIAAHR